MRSEIEIKQLLDHRIETYRFALENNMKDSINIYQILIDELKWILNDTINEL